MLSDINKVLTSMKDVCPNENDLVTLSMQDKYIKLTWCWEEGENDYVVSYVLRPDEMTPHHILRTIALAEKSINSHMYGDSVH